jgi:hypothetical protein
MRDALTKALEDGHHTVPAREPTGCPAGGGHAARPALKIGATTS